MISSKFLVVSLIFALKCLKFSLACWLGVHCLSFVFATLISARNEGSDERTTSSQQSSKPSIAWQSGKSYAFRGTVLYTCKIRQKSPLHKYCMCITVLIYCSVYCSSTMQWLSWGAKCNSCLWQQSFWLNYIQSSVSGPFSKIVIVIYSKCNVEEGLSLCFRSTECAPQHPCHI